MSKETGVILIGIWVFILPFLGIPGSWRATLLTITGIGLVLLGFILIYPMLTGIPLNKQFMVKFFDINLTKNPFAQ